MNTNKIPECPGCHKKNKGGNFKKHLNSCKKYRSLISKEEKIEPIPETTPDTPPQTTPESGFQYPKWNDFVKKEESKTDQKQGMAPIEPLPMRLPTKPLWKFINVLVDKDNPLTPEELSALEESFDMLGFGYEPNEQPIVIPFWLPFLIVIIGVFGFKLIKNADIDLGAFLKEKWKKIKEG